MPRPFPVQRAREHLESLADKHRIAVTWMRHGAYLKAVSYPPLRIAFLPRPTDGLRYMIGLHELGHCVSRGARRWEDNEDVYGLSVCEGYAWAWAAEHRDHSVPVTRLDWAKAGNLIASYWASVPQEAEDEDPLFSW